MKILESKLFGIEHNGLSIQKLSNQKTGYEVGFVITTDKSQNLQLPHLIFVTIEILLKEAEMNISSTIANKFEVKIEGNINDHYDKISAWQISDLVQISMAHSRVIFKALCAEKEISVGYYKCEPIGFYYQSIMSGYGRLWN